MDAGIRIRILMLLGAVTVAPGVVWVAAHPGDEPVAAVAVADTLPPGVTPAMVDAGRKLYGGAGLCVACHGPAAKGSVGPDLTDAEWLHSDGSYDAIVATVVAGVPAAKAVKKVPMPPRGGAKLSEEQVRAVAAYVWTLGTRSAR